MKGALSDANFVNDVVKLSNADINNKVTVSGIQAFNFASDYSGLITGSSDSESINVAGSSVTVLAGSAADSILSSGSNITVNAGAGNDTLIGGKGSDSLLCDAGADTFLYSKGGGKDTIYSFSSNDILTFNDINFKESMATYSKGSVVLKFGSSNSITLANIDSDASLNIAGSIYTISSSKLDKYSAR